MKLGAEPKKTAILAGLLCVAGYLFWSNVLSSGDGDYTPPPARTTASTPPPAQSKTVVSRPASGRNARAPARQRGVREFRPSLKPRREEDRPDPMTIDPTLRLDLLAKLQDVEIQDVKRSLFDFGRPPAPKPKDEPKIEPAKLEEIRRKQEEAAAKLAKKTTKPPPPPINLKFYGFISAVDAERKRAFFLDGEDIFVATEGETVKTGRYKIVKIGVNSAVVEDTENDHQQTLKLEEARS